MWRANEPDQAPYPGTAIGFDAQTELISSFDGSVTQMSAYWNFRDEDRLVDVAGVAPGVFKDSALTRFDVLRSNAFTTIGDSAFEGSQLQEIRLFDSVTTIDAGAFRNCKALTSVVIPDSVTSIGAEAFAGCDKLRHLVLPARAEIAPDALKDVPFTAIWASGAMADADMATLSDALGFPWYEGLRREGEPSRLVAMPAGYVPSPEEDFEFDAQKGEITKYIGSQPHVAVPRQIGGVEVGSIGQLAFSNLSVYSVAAGRQDNTGLQSVVLPDTVFNIADSAFLNCTALTRVEAWGPIDRVGNRAFEKVLSN